MIEVKKKDGESNESLIRRFVRKVQGSGSLLLAKNKQFHKKKKNKRQIRLEAIRKTKVRKEYDHLRKIGKLEETYGRFGAKNKKNQRIKIKKANPKE